MKSKLASIVLAVAAFAFSGCVTETPMQAVATGVYASGTAVANDAMLRNANVQAQLADIAVKLPQINTAGALKPADYGALSQEIANVSAQVPTLKTLFPQNASALNDAEAFLAAVIQSNAQLNGGRAPTADQVVASAALIQFSNGLTDGISYALGKKTVPAVPAP